MKRRVGTTAIVAVTALGAMAVPSAAGTATARDGGVLPGAAPGRITLITGDRVTVSGVRGATPAYRVEPGPGRAVSFTINKIAGHVYVLPSDAAPLVGKGLVDRRLFDITQLLEWRYDDAHRSDIPVMTQGGSAPHTATTTRSMTGLGLSAARVPKAQAATVWRDLGTGAGARTLAAGVTRLWLDGNLSYSLDKSVPQIGAPDAWRQGLTGKGVTVAVLDSGYDPAHPDLKGVVTQSANFSDEPDTSDNVGHGTHVASIVAGSGQASGGRYRGVAPDAKIALGKVGGAYGVSESALIAGMDWAATRIKAPIVNISIGGRDGAEIDPLEQAVNTLSERTGSLFVIAAGNEGGTKTINSPGSADAALTVGAVDASDRLAGFSSRGPRQGDGAVKPDLTAPGVEIVAAAATSTPDPYIAYSGTSMATPHVVGAAAIVSQLHPDWNGARLKSALIASAKPAAGATQYQQGAGRVDVVHAIAQKVVADSANISAFVRWPGTGGQAVTRTLTYTNTSSTPVDLTLAHDGPFTLSTNRLSLPAGGQAPVTLTLPTGLKPGSHPGVITATAAGVTVRTLAGAYIEPESYDVTVKAIARDGTPLDWGNVVIYQLTTGEFEDLSFTGGIAKTRLPRGDWNIAANLTEPVNMTLTHQRLHIGTRDEHVVLDARKGQKIRFSLDDPAAKAREMIQVTMRRTEGEFLYESTLISFQDPNSAMYVLPSRQRGLGYLSRTVWETPGASGHPKRYDLVDYRSGMIPADPGVRGKTASMAKITTTFRGQGIAAAGGFERTVSLPGPGGLYLYSTPTAVQAPGALSNYLSPGHRLPWLTRFSQGTDAYTLGDAEARTVEHGHFHELWNAAAIGPAAPTIARARNEVAYWLSSLFTDSIAGREGWDGNATGSATLSKDGVVLKTIELKGCAYSGICALRTALPAGPATYKLNVSAQRNVPYAALTTAVDTTWSFTSGHVPTESIIRLPSVKYTPLGLDDGNRARPGSSTPIPMSVEGGTVRTLKVEASFDDGRTWRPLESHRTPKGWITMVTNPAAPGFVSLRATGDDGEVTQTITRAYAVQG